MDKKEREELKREIKEEIKAELRGEFRLLRTKEQEDKLQLEIEATRRKNEDKNKLH